MGNPPTHLIRASAGTAILFGGQVTHAAQPIISGERVVFVASFSRRDCCSQALDGILVPDFDPAKKFRFGRARRKMQPVADETEECSLEELCLALSLHQEKSSSLRDS